MTGREIRQDEARQILSSSGTQRISAPHLPYRPGIDGLRAIAVLSVVLYHFGVPGLGGGFVGVDVFFVISGFLIGGLLWKERRETGRIALGAFWMRRVRRLAPAYFTMAAVSAIAAWFILLPFELRDFGKSLIAATLWLSNVQFWRDAGYFDIGSDSKVLLHTWSLSVEEQFYVVLPLFVAILGALRRSLAVALCLLWAASLYYCVTLSQTDSVATFYLFPFRAWELLTGVLLAIWMQAAPRRVADAVPLAGLVLIIAAIVFVRPEGFPGWQVILPVAGAAMVLAGQNEQSPTVRLLSRPEPVTVGLVSYSLYLWHWPVLVLSTYWRGSYGAWWESALWLALAIVLAVLSWAFIERPLRRAAIAPRRFVGGAIIAGGLMLAFGALAYVRDGLPGRFPAATQAHIAASQDFLQDWSRCTIQADGPLAGLGTCAIGPEGPPRVLVWGDSHLRALMDGIGLAALETEVPGLIVWHAGCPPLFGLLKQESAATAAEDADCTIATETLRAGIVQMDSLERVLLVGRWTYYAKGSGTGIDAENLITLSPAPGSGYTATSQSDLYAQSLSATAAELGRDIGPVFVLRQVPEIPNYSSRDVARALAHGRLDETTVGGVLAATPEVLAARSMDAERPQFELATSGAITLIDPWPLLCEDRCSVMHENRPIYFDNNHLTNDGARVLRGLFVSFLTGEPEAPPPGDVE